MAFLSFIKLAKKYHPTPKQSKHTGEVILYLYYNMFINKVVNILKRRAFKM